MNKKKKKNGEWVDHVQYKYVSQQLQQQQSPHPSDDLSCAAAVVVLWFIDQANNGMLFLAE